MFKTYPIISSEINLSCLDQQSVVHLIYFSNHQNITHVNLVYFIIL